MCSNDPIRFGFGRAKLLLSPVFPIEYGSVSTKIVLAGIAGFHQTDGHRDNMGGAYERGLGVELGAGA